MPGGRAGSELRGPREGGRKSREEKQSPGEVASLLCALETGLSGFPRVRGQASQQAVDFLDLAPFLLTPQGRAGQEV